MQEITRVGKDVEEKKLSSTGGQNANFILILQPLSKTEWKIFKKFKTELSNDPVTPILDI